MMKLSNGTIVHFRQPGLKEGRTKDIIRYYKIVGELGQGRRTVYKATPVRKAVPSAEKAEKRKRTTTDNSVVAVEAGPSGSAAKAGDDEHPIELGSSVVQVEPSVVPVNSTAKLPISIVEVASSNIVLPAPAPVIEVGTSRGAKGRFVSKKKKRKTANAGVFGAPADSATISSSTITATTSIQPPHPTVVVPHPIPEKFENVPDEPDVAIKFDYMTAREHRKFVGVPAVDRLGKLGEEFYSGIQLSVTGAVVEPMMCGWLEILQPAESIWMVGLFLGLMMPIYEDGQPSLQQDPIMSLEAAAGSRTVRPIGDDSKGRCPIDDSELRCPVHLPWGDCMIIKDNIGRMVIKVPGKYDGIKHTFHIVPGNHAIGYPRMKHVFYCAGCPEEMSSWGAIWNHSNHCEGLPTGTSCEKLEGEDLEDEDPIGTKHRPIREEAEKDNPDDVVVVNPGMGGAGHHLIGIELHRART
ncbi:hypothetical protein HD553DRAFT_359028 [Filobasidium floriforme]|uniref:uncharacterized protein n=1 Tax=Filobasidium floriforme TaxID=5210 RepID=UPI001E8DE3AC|nr:uncharacterized protein HD553DRAFT_359028 [Filobasidium floriforme]KAH8081914.1 hypothetical protein HD553DRAFT_359028 [Filobasidium floriforme]